MDLDEYQFRYDAGVCIPSHSAQLDQKDIIVQSLIKHYLVHVCKSELDELKSGCSELGMLALFHTHPTLFRPLLTISGKPKLTAKLVVATFEVKWSLQGSNAREQEEAVILGWKEYLRGIESEGWKAD